MGGGRVAVVSEANRNGSLSEEVDGGEGLAENWFDHEGKIIHSFSRGV